MGSPLDHAALQERILRPSHGRYDRSPLNRLTDTAGNHDLGAELFLQTFRKRQAVLGIRAEHSNSSNRPYGDNRLHLAESLLACPNDCQVIGVLTSEAARGDARSGCSPHLSQIEGFDDGAHCTIFTIE